MSENNNNHLHSTSTPAHFSRASLSSCSLCVWAACFLPDPPGCQVTVRCPVQGNENTKASQTPSHQRVCFQKGGDPIYYKMGRVASAGGSQTESALRLQAALCGWALDSPCPKSVLPSATPSVRHSRALCCGPNWLWFILKHRIQGVIWKSSDNISSSIFFLFVDEMQEQRNQTTYWADKPKRYVKGRVGEGRKVGMDKAFGGSLLGKIHQQ